MKGRVVCFLLILGLSVGGGRCAAPRAEATRVVGPLPERLSDAEFASLIHALSEPNGFFDSDNLVSNEDTFQTVVPELTRTIAPGGVYLGVGPDQNFTYIASLAPKMAFITDIRRGNLLVHLMYKALIEVSTDRADFLSRLFSRQRPPGLNPQAIVNDVFDAFGAVAPDRALFDRNRRALIDRLNVTHGLGLDAADVSTIESVYGQFFAAGPDLRFVSNGNGRFQRYPSYQDLQTSSDAAGKQWSYLANERQFNVLKDLETRNLVVPLVGNFGGPKALRAVGAYVREHGATVSVFYLSNVERYLFQDGLWRAFLENVASLPQDEHSTVIRSCFDSCSGSFESRAVSMLDSMPGLVRDAHAGRITTYRDVLARSHR